MENMKFVLKDRWIVEQLKEGGYGYILDVGFITDKIFFKELLLVESTIYPDSFLFYHSKQIGISFMEWIKKNQYNLLLNPYINFEECDKEMEKYSKEFLKFKYGEWKIE